jgi:hypothetical protein
MAVEELVDRVLFNARLRPNLKFSTIIKFVCS